MSKINSQAESARESARQDDGKFGSYNSGESGASLMGSGAPTISMTFEESRDRFEETFSKADYVEIRRHHAVDSQGLVRRDGRKLKHPKVTKGFQAGDPRSTLTVIDSSETNSRDTEEVCLPPMEAVGSITENDDGSFTITSRLSGSEQQWDVRPIDWEDTHHPTVDNPLEVTERREKLSKSLYDSDVRRYQDAVKDDPGSVEMRPTENGYEYDQDQLKRAERLTEERRFLVQRAMSTASTPGGRKHVEDSLDNLDVEGRWQIKEALERIDEPRYAQRRANIARAAQAGYGRDAIEVPDRVIEQKLSAGQTIRYKAIDADGPDAQWQEATVSEMDFGGIGYDSGTRSAVLTLGNGPSGKSFHRDADGHYIQTHNSRWSGAATVFDFGEGAS